MTRRDLTTWLGLGLLSAAWLWGLSLYAEARPAIWALLSVLGLLLMRDDLKPTVSPRQALLGAVLLLPAGVLLPWPGRLAPLALALGLVLPALPAPRTWPAALGRRLWLGGAVLSVQGLALWGYLALTARGHDLPVALQWPLLGVARGLGIDAALDGRGQLALYTMRAVHRLALTWELLLGPTALCLLAGTVVLLSLGRQPGRAWRGLLWALLLWIPAQVGVQTAALIQRALRTGYEQTVTVMAPFWNPWVQLLVLAALVGLLARFVRLTAPAPRAAQVVARRGALLLALAATCLCLWLTWERPGRAKAGRIWVDEHHSTWEPTQRPFDTTWYGNDSGYNYACIYDYSDRYFQMGRLQETIGEHTLDDCDVLIVKVPTARYEPQEIDGIEAFVRRGGGVLFVGEHTNVFNTSTYLNDITRRFGFRFRSDCLFDIDTPFEQRYTPPLIPHPIVQRVPALNFAVSCSIAPGLSPGRAAVRSTGLRSLPADYHASNFYPQVTDRADARAGAFVQLWTRCVGRGRVAAFADSTIFSNFATFEPGKAELWLGMLAWLNERNTRLPPGWLGLLAGCGLLAAALRSRRGRALPWLVAVWAGWSLAVVTVRGAQARDLPAPTARRSYVDAVLDRTVCDTILPTSGFIAGEARGFGIFERWILRLGYFTRRARGPEALTGDLLVLTYPTGTVTAAWREAVVDYVERGGHLLVLDDPANTGSTANSLLHPFGLSLERGEALSGSLRGPDGDLAIPVESAVQVTGGRARLWVEGHPVAARVERGAGSVTVVGCGARFCDREMGVTGDVVPDEALRRVFDLEYALIRGIVEPNAPSASPQP